MEQTSKNIAVIKLFGLIALVAYNYGLLLESEAVNQDSNIRSELAPSRSISSYLDRKDLAAILIEFRQCYIRLIIISETGFDNDNIIEPRVRIPLSLYVGNTIPLPGIPDLQLRSKLSCRLHLLVALEPIRKNQNGHINQYCGLWGHGLCFEFETWIVIILKEDDKISLRRLGQLSTKHARHKHVILNAEKGHGEIFRLTRGSYFGSNGLEIPIRSCGITNSSTLLAVYHYKFCINSGIIKSHILNPVANTTLQAYFPPLVLNPFNPPQRTTYLQHIFTTNHQWFNFLINLVVAKGTACFLNTSGISGSDSQILQYYFSCSPNLELVHNLQNQVSDGDLPYIVVLDSTNWNFVSCDGTRQTLSYTFYLEPFDNISWIMVAGSLICMCLFFIICYVKKHLTETCYITYTAFALLIGNLLESPYQLSKRILKNRVVAKYLKALLLVWSLICIVLTNWYRNILVADLVGPLPILGNWSSFSQMREFRFYADHEFGAKMEVYKDNYRNISVTYMSRYRIDTCRNYSKVLADSDDKLVNEYLDEWCKPMPRLEELVVATGVDVSDNDERSWLIIQSKFKYDIVSSIGPRFPEPGQSPDAEFRELYSPAFTCTRRAIILKNEEIRAFMTYAKLRNKMLTFIEGNEASFSDISAFKTSARSRNLDYSYRNLQVLMSSGIYGLWKKWFDSKFLKGEWEVYLEDLGSSKGRPYRRSHVSYDEEEHNNITPLNLDSNIISCMYIYLVGAALSVAFFLIECLISFFPSHL